MPPWLIDEAGSFRGGPVPQRRMRFVLKVVRRIRARVSPGFAVGIKLNSEDFQRGAFTEDESRAVVSALAGEGLDLARLGTLGHRRTTAAADEPLRDRDAISPGRLLRR